MSDDLEQGGSVAAGLVAAAAAAGPDGATPAQQPRDLSLAATFLDCVARRPDREAFRHPGPRGWTSLTWAQTGDRAVELAAGLLSLGLRPHDRVAIAASTRLEWVLADLAVLLAAGATTTVYPTTRAPDVAFILADSGSRFAIVEDGEQLDKVAGRSAGSGGLEVVIVMDPGSAPRGSAGVGDAAGPRVLSLAELADLGRDLLARRPGAVEDAVAAIRPADLATLIYTSGTTGRPKGVELTHGNWLYIAGAVEDVGIVRADQLQFLWLPLSHVFGKLLLAAQLRIGFATAVDGRIDRIVDNLADVRPTFMAAAPRIFEKVHARVVTVAEGEGGVRARIFRWAFAVGLECVARQQEGRAVPATLRLRRALADRLVFARIRGRLGGRIETLVSGSAALSPQVARWFAAAGLPILEGYGMTECGGASFVNRPGAVRIGTVGQALPGTQVRIAADGEILLRAAGVMRGYHGLPAETAQVLLADGWVATGDVGELDADGYLRITDRKKDLVKTSGGKYIAPSQIEGALKAANPLIGQVVVIAQGRRYVSALLTMERDTGAAWAQSRGLALDTVLTGEHPQVRAELQAAVDAVNAGLNRWETVKQFRVLPAELSVEAGELTPSLKVKRAVVNQRHGDVIEAIYGP